MDDVVSGVREYFLDEGIDEQVLVELKQIWLAKLNATKAAEPLAENQTPVKTVNEETGKRIVS